MRSTGFDVGQVANLSSDPCKGSGKGLRQSSGSHDDPEKHVSAPSLIPDRARAESRQVGNLSYSCAALLLGFLILFLAPSAARAEFEVSGELLGYADECPVSFARVQVRNRTGEKTRCEMKLTGGSGLAGQVNIAPVEIEPDGERTFDIPVPLMPYPFLQVVANGRRIHTSMNRQSHRGLLFLNVAEMEKWGSEKELDEFSRQWTDPGSYHGGYSSPSGSSYRVVTQLEPDKLPENWLCYAPYYAVMCRESAYDRLPAGARAALMRWVDAGGHLTVYGSEKDETIRQMGGSIRFQSRNPLTFNSREMPVEWRRPRQFWSGNQWQNATGVAAEDKSFPYGVREMGGKAGAFGLATAFLFLAGPVNYLYFRRRGQIRRLMLSLPAISIGFCLIIMIYFIATQGFTRRGGSFAVSLLDESRGAALTFTRHSVFSGLYPLGGFRFDRETAFVPLRKAEDFVMELGSTTHLQSGIFQPTANFHYQTARPHTTREKLVYKADDQSVVNGFEKPIEAVVLSDGGRWFVAKGIAPGAKAKLERIPEERVAAAPNKGSEKMMHVLNGQLTGWNERESGFLTGPMAGYLSAPLPEGTGYIISFAEGDREAMQPGLAVDTAATRHVLLSVGSDSEKSFAPPPSPVAAPQGDGNVPPI